MKFINKWYFIIWVVIILIAFFLASGTINAAISIWSIILIYIIIASIIYNVIYLIVYLILRR